MVHGEGGSKSGNVIRSLDLAVLLAVIAAAGFLIARRQEANTTDLLPASTSVQILFATLGVLLAAGLWRVRRASSARGWWRLPLYLAACVLLGMAMSRVRLLRQRDGITAWPPRPEALARVAVDSLPPADAAEWALRVVLHAAVAGDLTPAIPKIPSSWRVPSQAMVAMRHTENGDTEIWSRAGEGARAVACHAIFAPVDSTTSAEALTPRCVPTASAPAGLEFHALERTPDSVFALPETSLSGSWPQYRLDATRSAAAPSAQRIPHTGWRSESYTDIRASASVIDSLAFVGGHGTGLLEAFHLASGVRAWQARVPNWVHQDPVSDGRVLLVGFGDNRRSFEGRAPSGVAAFRVTTGERLWTVFDESSVMTSPIILDSTLVYGSAAGVIRKRSLATGALVQQVALPGGVIMGPPVVRGDTLVVTLDVGGVCALRASTLQQLWCQRLPGLIYVGHASAAIAGDLAIVSAVTTATTLPLAKAARLPALTQLRLLAALLFPSPEGTVSTGQLFAGLDLSSGKVQWRSPIFPKRREVDGHPAGTAAIRDGIGVIVLPTADSVIAFELASGAVIWGAPGHNARGAPLIADDAVVVAGRDGVIERRDLRSGVLRCTLRRATGFDRAGPALTGDLMIFADLKGGVEAIPRQQLASCQDVGTAAAP